MVKTTYRFLVDGKPMSEEDSKRWLEASGWGANFANVQTVAERAADTAANLIRASENAKRPMLRPWEDIEWMMRGNPLSVDDNFTDVHVPETKKCVFAMAPRIVQALAGPGAEMFHVIGRDEQDRRRALRIEELLRYLLTKARYLGGAERRALCGLIYGSVAVGTSWEVRHRKQTVRKVREEAAKQGIRLVMDVEADKSVLAYEGFRWHLIDPRDLIWDPSALTSEDAQYAGERMRVPLHELLALEAKGQVTGVVAAVEGKNRHQRAGAVLRAEVERMQGELAKAERDGRAILPEELFGKRVVDAKDANTVEVTNLWLDAWSDRERPESADDWRAWQFMYVNGTPVRIAHNPYDSQHLPFAFAQLNHDCWTPWAISMAMDALPLQLAYDQTRALGARSHALHVSPFWSSDQGSDFESSLADLVPGQRVDGTGVEIHHWPSTLADTIAASDMFRRDIREITGVPEGFTGSDQSGTATQFEGNIQEANRRAQLMIFNLADLERQVVQHCFWYAQQFLSPGKAFRVLGRGARLLGMSAELAPEDLNDPVDIEIIGLRQFQSHGLRATRLATFNAQMAPYINAAVAAGRLDPIKLLEEGWLSIMGFRIDDQIMKPEMDPQEVMSPESENILLGNGQRLEVHPLDDHQAHVLAHAIAMNEGQERDESDDVQTERFLHMQKHAAAWQQQQQQQQAQQQAAAMAAQNQQVMATDGRKAAGEGRYHQREPDLSSGPAVAGPGQAPGPERPAAMAAPDRMQPTFQTTQ